MRERETQELLKAGSLGSDKKKKVSKGQWGVGFNKALAQNVAAEKVEMYGQAFKKIQEATRIEDIDQLVNTFLSAEDHNYTLFNYVNEVNQEIEKLEDQIVVIKSEVNKYREEGAELDRSKSAQAHDMEQKAAATGISSQLYEVRFASATSTMEALRNGISDIFNAIGCNTVAVRDLLGDDGVTDGNLLAYLGIVEQRTTEILQVRIDTYIIFVFQSCSLVCKMIWTRQPWLRCILHVQHDGWLRQVVGIIGIHTCMRMQQTFVQIMEALQIQTWTAFIRFCNGRLICTLSVLSLSPTKYDAQAPTHQTSTTTY